jgi:hypothetical protein
MLVYREIAKAYEDIFREWQAVVPPPPKVSHFDVAMGLGDQMILRVKPAVA